MAVVVLLQIKQMACLDIDGDEWKVKFSKVGRLLDASAMSTNSSTVYVWELRPIGSEGGAWQLQSKIVGDATTDEDQAMLNN